MADKDSLKGFTELTTSNWFREKIFCRKVFVMALSLLGVLVVAILVFCFLVVVMAALRPSVSISVIRGFRNKDAESDDEMQEEIKSINWKKGFFRLTLVFSVLFGIFSGIISADIHDSGGAFLEAFFMFFGLTWIIYFATSFVIRGFANKK